MNGWIEVFSRKSTRGVRTAGRTLVVLLLFGASALAVGCGPVQSTQRISQAEVAFERARVVEAHEKAPYEYKSAQYYLHKAKEEWGYSDFEASYDYATEAKSAAEAARLKAKEDPWPGHPVLGTSELKASDADKGPEGYTDEDEEASGPEGYMEEDEGSGSSESEDNGDISP